MRELLDKYLCNKYPGIFKDRHGDMRETAMCWGFYHGDGWFRILDELCSRLTFLGDYFGFQIIATQVKEKFGGLRFYHTSTAKEPKIPLALLDDKAYRSVVEVVELCIGHAEHQSANTCENCGYIHYGSGLRDTGWIYNMCDDCWAIHRMPCETAEERSARDEMMQKRSDMVLLDLEIT